MRAEQVGLLRTLQRRRSWGPRTGRSGSFVEPSLDPTVPRTGPASVFAEAVGAVFAFRGRTRWLFAVFGRIGFADGVSVRVFVRAVRAFARRGSFFRCFFFWGCLFW